MSRSGYSDDCDGWDLIRWRGAVKSAIKGARGQSLLRELSVAMDAMPVKELVADEFEEDGCFCALGVVGAARGMDMSALDIDDRHGVAEAFGVASALAAEIMDLNDRSGEWRNRWEPHSKAVDWVRLDREKRWRDVRAWVANQLKEPK